MTFPRLTAKFETEESVARLVEMIVAENFQAAVIEPIHI